MVLILIEFILYTALVAIISHFKTGKQELNSQEGYFLAGRDLTGVVIAGSMIMTNISAEQLVGTNGQSFAGNMSTIAWEATSVFSLVFFAFLMLPKFLKGGIYTMPEFFDMRYDRVTMYVFSIMFLIAYVFTMLPVILYSGAVALQAMFDISDVFQISYFTAIAIICGISGIIGMCYAVFGGLKSIAYSDTINGIGLIVGGILVPVMGIIALGKLDGGGFVSGIQHLFSATPEKMNAWAPANALPPYIPWPLLCTGMAVNNLFYWTTNQSIIQRALAAKSLAEAQKGAVWAGFFKCLNVFVIVLPGVIAYQLLAVNSQLDTSLGIAADQAYPQLLISVVPKALLGILAAVLLGAILTSFNSVLNSASTIYTLNIYKPIFNKDASAEKLVKVGKNFGTYMGLAAIIISPFVMFFGTGIMNFINECWGFFSMPILIAVLFGLFNKRTPSIAPKITVPIHIVLYGLTKIIPFFNNFHYLYVVFVLFLIECAIYLLLIKVCPREEEWQLADTGAVDMTPWKNGKYWAIAASLVVVVMYIFFSPMGVAK